MTRRKPRSSRANQYRGEIPRLALRLAAHRFARDDTNKKRHRKVAAPSAVRQAPFDALRASRRSGHVPPRPTTRICETGAATREHTRRESPRLALRLAAHRFARDDKRSESKQVAP